MIEYVNIQRWMVDQLGLSGNELICYAIIFGFTQDGESKFGGSLKYICEWLSCTKPTAIKTLSSLVEKGYIVKHEESVNGVKFCRYSTPTREFNQWLKNLTGGGKEILPNNNRIDNIYTPSIDKSILPPKTKNDRKTEYAEGVRLTTDEFSKLLGELRDDTLGVVQFLSDYKKEKGYKTKSDYLTIKRWVIKAYMENKSRDQKSKKVGYAELYASVDAKYHPERYGAASGVDEQ